MYMRVLSLEWFTPLPSFDCVWTFLWIYGGELDVSTETCDPPKVLLKDSSNATGTSVNVRLVCNASGFSHRLMGKFSVWEKFESVWNADTYWTYFHETNISNIKDRLLAWNYPATKHICFPEGWGWIIGLISWQRALLANLMDLVSHVITSAAASIPLVTLIGWAVHNNFQLPKDLSAYGMGKPEKKFNFFKKRYLIIEKLLNNIYELLPGYYGVAGDRNLAGFTNLLISPGINAGLAGAWHAANLMVQVLAAPVQEAKIAMMAAAKVHQAFMHDFALPRLFNMNRLWYNSFRDHHLFESIPKTLWSVLYEDVDNHYYGDQRMQYSEAEAIWILGSGLNNFQAMCAEVLAVLNGANDGAPPSGEEVEKNHWGRWLRQYDHKLQKVPGKKARDEGFLVEAKKCDVCRYFVHDRTDMCPICGEKDVWKRA
ncbi:hypothetical protein B0H17DRAFT_1206387 [Mycena rosella]|uniref:Uncharacterized protein n=1 Tax=Mycena rosella TaxID=1033263 RepID=A0AAD7GBM3_MYCRO|nr:hypothetical protein B0H17DRAFT_1206387 [Mycena rosella]